MKIDGMPVEIAGEKNLLELIQKVGIKMPTFCYHSELSIYGACRMCMVENQRGGLEAACSTVPKDGMEIRTNTERLRKYRKNILELLLANHCRDCTTCNNNGKCKLQDLAMRFNIEASASRTPQRSPGSTTPPSASPGTPASASSAATACGYATRSRTWAPSTSRTAAPK
jgi:NADH-quinone oxidoreductase subunit G